MHNKITKILLLVTLLVLLIGITSAATVSENTTTTKVVKDTDNTPNIVVEKSSEKAVEKKVYKKENNGKNVKSASTTVDITDFNTLHSTLTSATYNNITVNIKNHITLADDTEINKAVQTLTINGNGKTINGNNQYQFLNISGATTVTINNITITRCKSDKSGAIENYGKLSIKDSILTDNTGWDGGAITNNGSLTITNSNLTDNTAWDGGAINNRGTAKITYSNLNGNTVFYNGGAINNNGTLNITNTRLSNNYAMGGVVTGLGEQTFIGGDGGAIYNTKNMALQDSILNNNNATYGGAIYTDKNTTLTISRSTLNDNYANMSGGAIYNNGKTAIDNSTLNKNNAIFGGAIISTSNLSITRSILNQNNADASGGAIHNDENAVMTLKNSTINNNNAEEGGAIYNNGKTVIDNSTLNNNEAYYGGAINNNGTLNITKTELNDNDANGDVFSINDERYYVGCRGGAIYNTKNMTIQGSILNNNYAAYGGAIYDYGKTIIGNSTLNKNTAEYGGAIYTSKDTTLTINRGILNENYANNSGGAIFNNGKTVIDNSTLNKNNAIFGGAILNMGNLTITKTTLNQNNANKSGGAIYNGEYTNISITSSNLNNNNAKYGGAIFNDKYSKTTINSSNLNYNNATNGSGGAIYNDENTNISITSSNLNNNNAEYGGAVINYGNLTMTKNTLNNNNAKNSGGAIYTDGNATINNCNLEKNNATWGGAIYNIEILNLNNNILNYNRANNNGGAIYNNGNLSIKDSTLKNNTAPTGGTIYTKGNSNITNSIFINNTAKDGSVIYSNQTNVTFKNNIMKSNNIINQTKKSSEKKVLEGKNGIFAINEGYELMINGYNMGMLTGYIPEWILEYSDMKREFIQNNPNYVSKTIVEYEYTGYHIHNNNSGLKSSQNTIYYNTSYEDMTPSDTLKSFAINNTLINEKTAITCEKINAKIGETTTITGKLLSNQTGIPNQPIIININNKKYTTTTSTNGVYSLKYNVTTIGTNNVTISYNGNEYLLPSNQKTTFVVNKITTKTTVTGASGAVGNKVTLKATVNDIENKKVNEGYVIFKIDGTTIKNNGKLTGTNNPLNVKVNNGVATTTIIADSNMTNAKSITAEYAGTNTYYPSSNTAQISIQKRNMTITLQPVKGIIGETITLKATLKDTNGTPINGGNLAFKLNGKTLRSDGRFDSKAPAMKFSVKNGLVTYTIKADLYLRNAKNLTASYSGTNTYKETTSSSVTAQIQKRYAQITLTTTPTRAKQYETLTFKVTAKDVTKNGKNNTLISDNTKVMLKVNGVTLKDNKGKTLYLTLDKNAQATYKYTIPAGTGGITAAKKARNYTVTAIFVGDNYYPGARNTTKFNVERSATYVGITQIKATKNNVLSVRATLKDYKGNYLIGTNKVTIKINGKNYIDPKNGKAKYWSVKNGVINLTGIQVDPKTTIKRVMIVTGERQAYHEGRNETTKITRA